MLLRLIKNKNPLSIPLIGLFSVLFWLPAILREKTNTTIIPQQLQMPFYRLFANNIDLSNYLTIDVIFALILTLFIAFLVARLNIIYSFTNKRTYIPALIFILISGSYLKFNQLNPLLPATIFFLFSIDSLFSSYKKSNATGTLVNCSMFLSIASLFYFHIIYFMIIIWIGLLLIRSLSIREFAITIIGMSVPYYFTYAIYYISLGDISIINNAIIANITYKTIDIFNLQLGIPSILFFIYLGLLSLLSINNLLTIKKQKIKTRKLMRINIWILLSSILFFLFIPSVSIEIIFIFSFPLSIIISQYLISLKSIWLRELFFIIFIMLFLYIQLGI